MTVFIHGTVLPRPSIRALVNALKIHDKNTSMADRYQNSIRQTGYSKNQPIQSSGLVPVQRSEIVEKDPVFASKLIAPLYQAMDDVAYNNTRQHHCYTFGWSGKLDHDVRVRAAQELYDALVTEKAELETLTKQPVKIHVLAHSHGGNVALNLGAVENDKQLHVDSLILYGTPIQKETENFVNSEIFETIYHLYSCGDQIQVADFLSTQDHKSRRTFNTNKKHPIELPEKLTQVALEVDGKKPFHYELWLFAYAQPPNILYRKPFALYPFPVMLFTPLITKLLEQSEEKTVTCSMHKNKSNISCTLTLGNESKTFDIDMDTIKKDTLAALWLAQKL